MAAQTGEEDEPKLLAGLKSVDIDGEGIFKYVLIEAYETTSDGKEHGKYLVRGYKRAEYHADIYEEVEEEQVRTIKGLDCQCLGGGRIIHEPGKKYLKVYGYSMGFGKADHTKAVKELKLVYPDYNVEWSDEGY